MFYNACFLLSFVIVTVCGNFIFPDEPKGTEDELKEIPLHIIRQLNSVSNISESEFFENFIDPESATAAALWDDIGVRSGEPLARKALTFAKVANCEPEYTTVKLAGDDARLFYYPSCTRVKRCGGCCSHELLACRSVTSEILHFSVVVTEYKGGKNERVLAYRGREIVKVEQHTKCRCECRVRSSDCSPQQKYDENACRCVCSNKDAEEKCRYQSNKLWSPTHCSCMCRYELNCPTGYTFDPLNCKCITDRTIKYNSTLLRETYSTDYH